MGATKTAKSTKVTSTNKDGLPTRYTKGSTSRVLAGYLAEDDVVRIPGTSNYGMVVATSTTHGYTTVVYLTRNAEEVNEAAFAVTADTWFTLI